MGAPSRDQEQGGRATEERKVVPGGDSARKTAPPAAAKTEESGSRDGHLWLQTCLTEGQDGCLRWNRLKESKPQDGRSSLKKRRQTDQAGPKSSSPLPRLGLNSRDGRSNLPRLGQRNDGAKPSLLAWSVHYKLRRVEPSLPLVTRRSSRSTTSTMVSLASWWEYQ